MLLLLPCVLQHMLDCHVSAHRWERRLQGACPGMGPLLPGHSPSSHAAPLPAVQTMADLLLHGAASFGSGLTDFIVVDCRYRQAGSTCWVAGGGQGTPGSKAVRAFYLDRQSQPLLMRRSYEYAGGCIRGALNVTTPAGIEQMLAGEQTGCWRPPCPTVFKGLSHAAVALSQPTAQPAMHAERGSSMDWHQTAIIFHCEFSSGGGSKSRYLTYGLWVLWVARALTPHCRGGNVLLNVGMSWWPHILIIGWERDLVSLDCWLVQSGAHACSAASATR